MVRRYRRYGRRRYGRRLQGSETLGYRAGSNVTMVASAPFSSAHSRKRGRRRSRSGTGPLRRRTMAIVPMQHEVRKYRLGRNMPTTRMLRTLDRVNHNFSIGRFSSVSRCTESGASNLSFTGPVPPDVGVVAYPLHLIELTQKPAVTNNGTAIVGTMNVVAARYGMIQTNSDTTNTVSWVPVPGTTTAGTTGVGAYELLPTNVLTSTTSGDQRVAFGQAYLEWSKVKFCFRTPLKRAGRITVELIQINDDDAMPNIVSPTTKRAEITNSWQHALTGYLYNPIKTDAALGRNGKSVYRVIKRWTKSFQPSLTVDADTSANHVRMEFFLRLNHFVNFSSTVAGGDGGNVTTAEMDSAEPMSVQLDTDARSSFPSRSSYRRFLLVKCTNWDVITPTISADTHVSYDVDIQNKWVYRPGSNAT